MAGKTIEIQNAYLWNTRTSQSWSIRNHQAQSQLY